MASTLDTGHAGRAPIDRSIRVGFVGLGNLGQPMALALLRAGWQLSVLDSAPEKAEPCVREGARLVEGAHELADCGVVALVVPDDAAVESVLEGPDGIPLAALGAGSAGYGAAARRGGGARWRRADRRTGQRRGRARPRRRPDDHGGG
jgi:NAD binding domain of 6-phosphogluconate dehydrogenase